MRRTCPKCGWPDRDCKCSVPREEAAGGSVFETGVEIQGDMRDRVRLGLADKGFVVKG